MSQTMREALMSLARREDTNLTWADRVLIGKVIAALSAPSSERAQQGTDCPNCFEGKSDMHHVCRVCSGTGKAQGAEPSSPYLKALDIRMSQGWQLSGNACPVFYTDSINGEQVCRDDLWIATTQGLKGAEQKTEHAAEMSPDFTDTARAALLWVLWHHQGGSSKVGQPIRFALGMGAHDDLSAHQVREARRWEALAASPASEQAQQGVDAWRFQWAALIARWDEVEASHLEEVGLGWTKAWLAPKTYALMQEILDSARATTVPNEANHE